MPSLLIIEDEQIQSSMYSKIFSNHSFIVDIANDGKTGLEKALSSHPDLILLDIRMPVMDGIDVLHALRQDTWGKKAKIMILTNYDATISNVTSTTLNDSSGADIPEPEKFWTIVDSLPDAYIIKTNNRPEEVLKKAKDLLGIKEDE